MFMTKTEFVFCYTRKYFQMLLLVLLRELRRYNLKIVFISNAKIGENTTSILSWYIFFKFYILVHQNETHVERTKCSPHKQSSRTDIQRKLLQTKVFYKPLLCFKRNTPQFSKCSICKELFLQCVCYWYSLPCCLVFYSM